MLDRAIRSYSFDISDDTIRELVVASLLGKQDSEIVLAQGEYSYKVKGGESGYLSYRKGKRGWILIANWCFYGLYIVVRYRKPLWLRPMYRSLFAEMNFASVTFHNHSIELIGRSGEILRGRKLRLSPPSAFEEVMTEKFGYSQQEAEDLKLKVGI